MCRSHEASAEASTEATCQSSFSARASSVRPLGQDSPDLVAAYDGQKWRLVLDVSIGCILDVKGESDDGAKGRDNQVKLLSLRVDLN